MQADDIEIRLNSVRNMLDELTKELQNIMQNQIHHYPAGEEPQTDAFERCIARVSSIAMMTNNITHDLSVVKHNVTTLHDLLGCKGVSLAKKMN